MSYPVSIKACQAMAILGMLASFVVLAMAIVDIYHKVYEKLPIIPFPTVVAASTLASFVFILIGIIVWGADLNYDQTETTNTNDKTITRSSKLGYSFGLSITGGILILIGGLMYFFNHRRIAG
ncbi:uncharacterized protein LOC131951057 [Physella acuta]|uniref:uncharacterized protein LOC131951057 n=1 Tax=Physella acuta TaxID=109671 RepID=UPI0027DDF695|nr:uncharacterized protein LOC131951057 [Physella acuta]